MFGRIVLSQWALCALLGFKDALSAIGQADGNEIHLELSGITISATREKKTNALGCVKRTVTIRGSLVEKPKGRDWSRDSQVRVVMTLRAVAANYYRCISWPIEVEKDGISWSVDNDGPDGQLVATKIVPAAPME